MGISAPPQPFGTSQRANNRDARGRPRLRLSLPVHLRPFDARFAEIEDVGQVVDFTRDGIYFKTCMPHYFLGMRLTVTFPYGDNIATHRHFLGLVMRIDDCVDEGNGDIRGIAVRFLL